MSKILNTIAAFSLVAGMSSGAMATSAFFPDYDKTSLKQTFLYDCNGGDHFTDPHCQKGTEWVLAHGVYTSVDGKHGMKFEGMSCEELAVVFYANTAVTKGTEAPTFITVDQYNRVYDELLDTQHHHHKVSPCEDVED